MGSLPQTPRSTPGPPGSPWNGAPSPIGGPFLRAAAALLLPFHAIGGPFSLFRGEGCGLARASLAGPALKHFCWGGAAGGCPEPGAAYAIRGRLGFQWVETSPLPRAPAGGHLPLSSGAWPGQRERIASWPSLKNGQQMRLDGVVLEQTCACLLETSSPPVRSLWLPCSSSSVARFMSPLAAKAAS